MTIGVDRRPRSASGHPGTSRRRTSAARSTDLGDRAGRACTTDDADRGRPAAGVGRRGHPGHRAACSGTLGAAVRSMPEGLRTARSRWRCTSCSRPRPTTDDATTIRSIPRAGSTPTRWSATRSASSCRSLAAAQPRLPRALCSVCGGDRNLGECPGDHPSIDPRWAGLEHAAPGARGPELNRHRRPRKEATRWPSRRRSRARRGARKRAANWKARRPAYARMPAVPAAQAPAPRVRQLRVLRRPPGRRGRVTRVSAVPSRPPLDALDRALGVAFHDAALREAALTHRSYAFEQRHSTVTNERLEFLGDSVLGLVVTDMAYRPIPDLPEGSLAKLARGDREHDRRSPTSRAALGLGGIVLLGKGEEHRGGRDKSSILADALEAVFGAVYLDRGSTSPAGADRAAVPPADGGLRARRGRPRLQDDPAGARVAGAAARCPSTGSRNAAPITRRSSRPRCSWAARAARHGHRALQEGSRAAGGTRGAHAHLATARAERGIVGGRGGATRGRGDAPGPGEGRRRSPDQDGRGQAARRTRCASSAVTRSARTSRRGSTGAKIAKVERRGKYLLMHARLRRRAGGALRHERPVPARNGRVAHRRPTPTWSSRSNRAATSASSTRGRSARCSSPRADELGKVKELQHMAIDPLDQVFTWPTFQYLLAETRREDEAAADGPEVHQRASATSTPTRCCSRAGIRFDRMSATRCPPRRCAGLYRAIQEMLQEAIKAARHRRSRTRRTSTCSASRGVRERAEGLRPRGPAVPAVPHADPDREDQPAQLVLLPAVPELDRRLVRRSRRRRSACARSRARRRRRPGPPRGSHPASTSTGNLERPRVEHGLHDAVVGRETSRSPAASMP